jgi:hypothetical protein
MRLLTVRQERRCRERLQLFTPNQCPVRSRLQRLQPIIAGRRGAD